MQTQFFELFSGEGAVSRIFKSAGVPTVSYDVQMDSGRRTMDFLSEGGFASKPKFPICGKPNINPRGIINIVINYVIYIYIYLYVIKLISRGLC